MFNLRVKTMLKTLHNTLIYTFFIFFKRTRCLYKVLYTKGSPFTPKGEHLTIGFTRFCIVENHSYLHSGIKINQHLFCILLIYS